MKAILALLAILISSTASAQRPVIAPDSHLDQRAEFEAAAIAAVVIRPLDCNTVPLLSCGAIQTASPSCQSGQFYVDLYTFNGTVGSSITVTASSAAPFSLLVTVQSASDGSILASSNGSSPVSVTYTFPTTAQYFIGFGFIGYYATGQYTLSVACGNQGNQSCFSGTMTACVLNNRFQVRVRVHNHFANPQYDFDASVKSVTGFASTQSETAFFHFGDANNIEMLVKLLNAGNSGIAVLYGVATPFEVWLTITDTRTGAIQTYHTARDAMNGQTQFGAFPLDVPSPTNLTFTAPADLDSKTVGEFYSYSFCQPPITGNALCSSPPATNPTGGLSPYHFQLGSGVGFPPSGVQLALNGILSGTASVQGDSTFQVCAVDLAGTSRCSTVHQHIGPASTPPPASNFYANWDCQNQSQCIAVMGHNQGSAGPFCSSTSCAAWRQAFFFGATCDAQATYPIYFAPPPGTCSNYPN